jgi:malonate-semialdehyde dehydrogenase (acetylating)/methylmalonate-semialdehyde dehydrogenase
VKSIGHVISGKPVEGVGRTAPVHDPGTGLVTGHVSLATTGIVDEAVDSARQAAQGWAATSVGRRAEVMFRLWHIIDSRRSELAQAISQEHGKVLSDALGEVARALENVEFACGAPHLLKGGYSERVATDIDVHELKQPLGVVAGITPFNFPLLVPVWMAASALVCGNAMVLKPSEKVPSASRLLAEMLSEAGLPEGVLNVVNGDKAAVDHLLQHADVAAVSFVGSTPVAKHVYERAAAHGKRVQALGGAKNHMVVLPDADVQAAADAAVSGAFGSAGERCMAVSVVVAVGDVADDLVRQIAERTRALQVGPATDGDAQMGPLITAAHRDRVAGYVREAAAEGATVVEDGSDRRLGGDGFFMAPAVIDHVTPSMSAYRDEIFGPVLSVVRAGSLAEAMALVNSNPFGNGTAIFTADGAAARAFSSGVSVGMVGVNVPVPVPAAFYSFGGWKASLFGDCHIYGPESFQFYTRTKVVTSRWHWESPSSVNLDFPRNR